MSTNHTSSTNGHSASASKEPEATPLDDVAERLGPKIEEAQDQLVAINERVKLFVKENPGTTLLGAAALGFLIGRLASRR